MNTKAAKLIFYFVFILNIVACFVSPSFHLITAFLTNITLQLFNMKGYPVSNLTYAVIIGAAMRFDLFIKDYDLHIKVLLMILAAIMAYNALFKIGKKQTSTKQ